MKTIPRRLIALAAIAAFVLVTSPASALTDAEKAELKETIEAGTAAYKEGRFMDAVAAFERAEEISPDPRIQYNLGRALEEAGECTRATERFRLLSESEKADKVVRERAAEKVEGKLDCTPVGTVAFTCETPSATVMLDGTKVACGSSVRTEVAEKTWKAFSDGYLPARGTVTPVEGETVTVVIGLTLPPKEGSPWKLFAGGGLVAAGAGLLAVGIISDSTATTRSEQIIDASQDGDRDRLARLQEASDSARTQTIVLYSSGAALAIGGGILLWLHFSEQEADAPPPVVVAPSIGTDGAGVQAQWRW